MKKLSAFAICLLTMIFLSSCKDNQENLASEAKEVDLIMEQFPEAQKEVKAVLDSLFISIQKRDIDKLLSYHLNSEKFTAFRDGLERIEWDKNEELERLLIKNISDFNYNLGNLKIAIFDKVAIVTFNADYQLTIGENAVEVRRQGTIVFVKNNGVWRIIHDHFSPISAEESE